MIDPSQTSQAAQNLVQSVANKPDFTQWLDLIEAILGNKFPDYSLEEIRTMLGLQAEDLRHTRFYQDVLKQGIVLSVTNFLVEKFGSLSSELQDEVSSLSSEQLQLLSKAMLHFTKISDFQAWLANLK